jgi:hypothetical protein
MKSLFLTAMLLVSVCTGNAQDAARQESKNFVPISDHYYWAGSEGNLGIEIIGKFESEAALLATMSLTTEVGLFKGRQYPFNMKPWTLRDILVSVSFDGNGSVATWRVSGPKPLVLSYLDGLKNKMKDESVFYDFGYVFINFRPSTD